MTMNLRHSALTALLAAVSLCLFACTTAPPPDTLRVGKTVARATLLDQHEKPHKIDESARFIFFAREMEGGAVIRALLEEEGPEYLKKHRILYIADISDMPTLIANMIAIPKMRDERPYPTLLDREGAVTAPYPSEEGRVTVMTLDKLKLRKVVYRGSVEGLRDAIARAR